MMISELSLDAQAAVDAFGAYYGADSEQGLGLASEHVLERVTLPDQYAWLCDETGELTRKLLDRLAIRNGFSPGPDGLPQRAVERSAGPYPISEYLDLFSGLHSSLASFAIALSEASRTGQFARSEAAAKALGGYDALATYLFEPSFVDAIETINRTIATLTSELGMAADGSDSAGIWALWLANRDPLFFLLDLHDAASGPGTAHIRWARLPRILVPYLEQNGFDGPFTSIRSTADATVGHSPHAPPIHTLSGGLF